MADGRVENFRRWFTYEDDVHGKVLASFETVPADRRDSAEFRRAVGLMGHVVAARRAWLGRIGALPLYTGPLFPEGQGPAEVAAGWEAVRAPWADYLAGLDADELDRIVDYRSFDGSRFRNRLEDILAQLFTHSGYHRGQIAMLVKAAGGVPAITDLIYWCREPVVEASS